jgi:hypothetical protein
LTVFGSAAQRKVLEFAKNAPKIDCILISRAKNLGIREQKNSNWLYFVWSVSLPQRNFWIAPTKATQIDCILCVQLLSEHFRNLRTQAMRGCLVRSPKQTNKLFWLRTRNADMFN